MSGCEDAACVVACFDLDGVLVDSEATKMSAFHLAVGDVLRPSGEIMDRIDACNRYHRGVPRRDKFTFATALAAGGHDAATVQALLSAYATLLADHLTEVAR